MHSFNKGSSWRLLSSKTVVVILVALVGFLANATFKVYERFKDSRLALEKSQRNYRQLKEREAALKREMDDLQTARGIEREIREKYRFHREGEKVAVFLDRGSSTLQRTAAGESFWTVLRHLFGF